MKFTTKDTIYIGLLAALCAVSTSVFIPFPTGGMFHLGSAALFTMGLLFGGAYAGLAGAIGSALFDLVMGQSPYTIFSFFIKGGAGLIVGLIAVGFRPPSVSTPSVSFKKAFIAVLMGAVVNALGYLVAWAVVLNSWTVAVTRLPSSFLTSGVGIVIALLLAPKLEKYIRRLLNQ